MVKSGMDSSRDELLYDSSKKFEIFSLISEKITQLTDIKTTLDEILEILSKVTGCVHLAVRILDQQGDFPLCSHLGLGNDFVHVEHKVSVNECLCGYIASGNPDKHLPYITDHGSFYANSFRQMVQALPQDNPDLQSIPLKDSCRRHGYESLAIIPIRFNSEIIAELYLSDEKKDLLPLEKVEFLEQVSNQIGISIQNSRLFSALNDSQTQLEDLFNSTSIGIFELDTQSAIIQINNFGAGLLGFSSSQSVLENDIRVFDLSIDRSEWEGFIDVLDSSDSVESFSLAFLIGGERQFLEFSLSAKKDGKGFVSGYQGTFRDITDSIRLEEERLDKAKTES
ncbi:GAF domain-containing protein, partial [Acidobacteriota bacterium]